MIETRIGRMEGMMRIKKRTSQAGMDVADRILCIDPFYPFNLLNPRSHGSWHTSLRNS